MLAHVCRTHSVEEVRAKLLHLREVMVECEQRGIGRTGLLPGALQVRRRAGQWHQRLSEEDPHRDPRFAEDWVNLVALAVNEENASGGRIVTAPTNGAAGIIPAVLHYAVHYTAAGASDADDVAVRFLLTAGAIGSLARSAHPSPAPRSAARVRSAPRHRWRPPDWLKSWAAHRNRSKMRPRSRWSTAWG